MPVRQPPLYVKLYLWFLVLWLIIGGVSALIVFAMGGTRLRAPRPDYGRQMVTHLSRALSGLNDEALRDTVENIHEDLNLDVLVFDAQLRERASAGTRVRPPAPFLEQARHAVIWREQPSGMVGGPLDAGVLVLHLPGPATHRSRQRRLALILAGLLIGGALLYPLSRSITRPLERLTDAAEQFGRGDLSTRSGIHRRDEVGRLANTFDEMAERIEAARRAERELLANVSHELRTPLARLQLASEMLDAKDDAARKRVDTIREEVDELNRLIGDVLAVSRLELSKLPLKKTSLPLRDLAEKARDRALALEPERVIDVDVPGDVVVPGDEALLSRVLDNLIDNALKYGGEGGPVRLEGRREDGSVLLAVQDRGPGIAADELDKVFDPFFRGDHARAGSASGFGLGLALARRVAEAHGGSIRALNASGGGARLEVRLPAAA
jgi:signal transduction histidine kinase